MRILAVDIGTSCGYCYNEDSAMFCGVWTLATAKEIKEWGRTRLTRRNDPRIVRLRKLVAGFCDKVDGIIIEDVEFSRFRIQTQMWASLRAAIWLACEECGIYYEAVNVKTLKKWATGNGNADKPQMLAAAQKQRPDLKFGADSADAFHLWTWAQKHIRV